MIPAESKALTDTSKENIPFRAPSRLINRNIAAKISVEPFGDVAKPTAPVVRTTNNVGFTNLPNQIHRKAVSRGFCLNLLITGFPGLGKSSFINALFCSDIYNKENPGPSKRPAPPTTRVDRHCFTLSEAHVRLRLCILDTPGFGQSLDNSTCWQPIVDCLESQFEAYLRAELSVSRKTVGSGSNCIPGLPDDNRVHACLYFVNPSGHGLHQVDVESLKKLHNLVNLILVIGKADTLTTEECSQFKQTISQQLQENGIQVYDFPESVVTLCGEPNEKTLSEVRSWRRRQPFAVVCSDRLIEQADGRKVRGRVYPWGLVETENLAHNDFTALKNLLMHVHLQDLIDVTHARHYANYYSARLTAIAEASQFPIQPEGREPLSQLEAEKAERQKKLAKLECEMEAVFEQKVQERTAKLQENERDLEQRVAQWENQMALQLAEFERLKRAFEQQRDTWEAENRDALEMVRASMEKLDFKDRVRSKRKGLF
ncbi:Cell division control gtp binding protein [Paragonimus heterotremus]|uniref:Cell division control gtp binding protein n=1 Tax=Paragonimus heterotremus TaxID=100268 RepID=A0A8J4TJU7_9TREM|nr:Cell division control gtp binding protein [Paragonimus heterotremus]